MDALLNTSDVAAYLDVAEVTLRKWRIGGNGPPFLRLGAAIRYQIEDIQAWLASQTARSTSQTTAPCKSPAA